MEDLIKRLEEATGGSQQLDAEIMARLKGMSVRRYPPSDDFGPKDRFQFYSADGLHFLGSEAKFGGIEPFTDSLDSALMALPPGWDLVQMQRFDIKGFRTMYRVVVDRIDGMPSHPHIAEHSHRAIALVIASLRAIQASKHTEAA